MSLDIYVFKNMNRKVPTTDEEKEQLETVIYWRKANAIHRWFSEYIIDKYNLEFVYLYFLLYETTW